MLTATAAAPDQTPGQMPSQAAPTASGPAQPVQTPASPIAYSAIAIHPDRPTGQYLSWWKSETDGFSANQNVRSLMMTAFRLTTPDQIEGLPAWGETQRFNIEARLDARSTAAWNKLTPTEQQARVASLLQEVLAQRFGLRIRREQRSHPIDSIVIAPGGPKLKQSRPASCGGYSMGVGRLTGGCFSIDSLAQSLSNRLGRLVVNNTGLTGKYDISLHWAEKDTPPGPHADPQLAAALEAQLGLRLVRVNTPVETIVIERVEKPALQ